MLMAARPSAVGEARAYARWVLGRWQLSAMADTVELLVSELVTNAVKATGIVCELADERLLAGKVKPVYLSLSALAETVLIEVWDASAVPPLRRVASADEETGRGLMLVQTLSKEWGCDVLETGGKVVWCKCLIEEAI
jgi:anti-sigma regulatory factor (Ser/Thr protein kinase)